MKDHNVIKDDSFPQRLFICIIFLIASAFLTFQAVQENFRLQNFSDTHRFEIDGTVQVFNSPAYGTYANVFSDTPILSVNSLDELYESDEIDWSNPFTIKLTLNRHFDYPMNTSFLFYLDRIDTRIYINNRPIYDSRITFPNDLYFLDRGTYWASFVSPGITSKDHIDVVFTTRSMFFNKNALKNTILSTQISTEPFILNRATVFSIIMVLFAICGIVLGAMTIVLYLLYKFANIRITQLFYFGCLVLSCGFSYVVEYNFNNFLVNMSSFYRSLYVSEILLVSGFFSMYLQSFLRGSRRFVVRILANLFISSVPFFIILQMFTSFDMYASIDVIMRISLLSILLTTGFILYEGKCEHYIPADRISMPSTVLAICFVLDMFTYSSSVLADSLFSRIGIVYFVFTQCQELIDYLVVIIQQTAEAKYYKELAYKDTLTHVANRTSWMERIKKINSDRLNIENYGVILFDLNNLKKVNDEMGHQCGDEFISSACKLICDVFNDCEVYRIGGDEFVALLRNYSINECDRKLMEFETICGKWNWENQEALFDMSVAAGGAVFDFSVDNIFEETVARADSFMYQCKLEMKGAEIR